MFVVFNMMALLIGGGSLVASVVAAIAFGWTKSNQQDHYGFLLFGALLGILDLAYRLRNFKAIHVPPPPTIITREGPVPTRPEPMAKLLNLFLSGEKGAQFFWVIPGWILALPIVYFSVAEIL